MNRKDAKQAAMDEKFTYGELREMISTARERGGMSRVNKQFSIGAVCDIYEAALGEKPDDERPQGMRYNAYKGYDVMSGEALGVKNILRDCR